MLMLRFRTRALLAAATASVAFLAASPVSGAASGQPYTFAVIGDIPYGAAQEAQLPHWIDQVNADRQVALVAHLGDIKSGSTACSDTYFAQIRTQFDRFKDPLVYTPGDNEWTDCHRPNNGPYNPLERLDAVRDVFFDQPGRTMGRRAARVQSQTADGYRENVRFTRAGVSFAAVHIVGSNNSLAPWTGATTATPEQTAEVLGRTAAAVEWIGDTFDAARRDRSRAVVLMTQADMFDPTNTEPNFAEVYGFQPIVAAIARESARYDKPVYLFNGDSHIYNQDKPLAGGSPWLDLYGIDAPVANLTRVTVDGSTDADNYLRVTINPRGRQVLDWERVPLT